MSLMTVPHSTRRALLTAMAAGAAMSSAAGSAVARTRLDLGAPNQRLRAYMLMRGALDDRLVIGFVEGRYYGVIDADIRPLFGVLGATFARYRPHPGGGYEAVIYEVPFFTDLTTGEGLERWSNPYTNETVAVPPMGFPPSRVIIGADLTLRPAVAMPGMTSLDRILETQSSGDDVWMTEESRNSAAIPGQPRPFHYNELVTTHARRSDLEAPGAMRVACDTAYQSISSWRPWQKMADHPGGLMAQGSGRYGARLEELPAAWLEIAKARRPDVLADPAAPLEALWAPT